VDEKLYKEGIASINTKNLSKVKEDQLAIRLQLETERTKIAVDSSQSRLLAAKSQVDQAKATYGLRISQSQSLRVRAGITGVLQLVPVEEGQNVAIGTNVARVADPKKLKAEVKIAETQAKDIVIGQKATIDTRNGVVTGHVSRIDPSVQNGTVTVDAVFDEPLPPGARADLSVDGTIELENLKDVLYVGRPVHGQQDSTISLFKITPDGSEATRTNVKLGRSSVTTIEVLSGLQVGDKVILSDMSQWDNVDRIWLKYRAVASGQGLLRTSFCRYPQDGNAGCYVSVSRSGSLGRGCLMTVVPQNDLARRDGLAIPDGTMLKVVAYTTDRDAAGLAVCLWTPVPGTF